MSEEKDEANVQNRKAGTCLLLPEAQKRPSPGSVDCLQLRKTSSLIFLSFNPCMISFEERGKKSHPPAHK